jgi:hypothetical protein
MSFENKVYTVQIYIIKKLNWLVKFFEIFVFLKFVPNPIRITKTVI